MTVRINLKPGVEVLRVKPWLDANQVHALFNQGKIWIDRDRTTHVIKKMSDHHLMYTHRFVRRHYERWRQACLLNILLNPIESDWQSMLSGDWEAVDRSLEKQLGELPKNVRKTPLFRALNAEMFRRDIEPLDI